MKFSSIYAIIEGIYEGDVMGKDNSKLLARLESKLDILEAEISHLDNILRKTGFPEGIATLKSTLEEILEESNRAS